MLIRLLNFFLVFFILTFEQFRKIFVNNKINFKSLNKKPFYFNLITCFSYSRTLKIINFLFKTKIFDCYSASALIKKINFNNKDCFFIVGALRTKNENYRMHAWIEVKDKIIFGHVKDIEQFKKIMVIV